MTHEDTARRIATAWAAGQRTTDEDFRLVMSIDPFAGDESDARILQDDVVTARKPHECLHCHGPIRRGERVRVQKAVVDGEIHTARWCAECCGAMALEALRLGEDCPDEVEDELRWYYPFGVGRELLHREQP